MICPECNQERSADAFLGKENCYKCQYKNKVNQPKPIQFVNCRQCNKSFQKSSRWVYCSWECQQLSENQQKKDYWTNHVV